MSGSSLGTIFKITTWGESHGKALGVVVDGCPAGVPITVEEIQEDLDRRKPGQNRFATQRAEGDKVQILSGIFEGKTTGTPVSMLILNEDQKSKDYDNIAHIYRPAHGDFGYDAKYGFRDYRGGGRSSGRETVGRVAAGAIAKKMLSLLGIQVLAYTYSIGGITIDKNRFDLDFLKGNPLAMPDSTAYDRAALFLDECKSAMDSVGGVVECIATNVPPGVGEPVFQKLDACLSQGFFSIGAVKGLEFGCGFAASNMKGSEYNDGFYAENGKIRKKTNHAGGITGGISDGGDILCKAYFKPTPSIAQPQQTVNKSGENVTLEIRGRHDPLIVARAAVVVESMFAVVLADLLLANMSANMENVKRVYQKENKGE